MDSTIAQVILQDRGFAYAITDRALQIVDIKSTLSDNYDLNLKCYIGGNLLDMVPELIGSEEILTDIMAGTIPRLQFSWVNRVADDGRVVYLSMVSLPYQNGQDISGILHLIEDVTEMGELDQELMQQRNELHLLNQRVQQNNKALAAANAELEQLAELKSMFVSIAAHELRTPLSAISGYIEMLLDQDGDPLTGDQRKYLRTVERGANRLLNITNNLLDITRIEIGRIDLHLAPCDLAALVGQTVTEIKPMFDAKSQTLNLHLSPDLPTALGDEVRINQIFHNLLNNASKYTPVGGKIAVNLYPAKETGFIEASIIDTGVGIPADDLPHLFDSFFRAKNRHETKATGAGLGLYITKALVELHGGTIRCESRLGQGTTFYLTFPTAE